MRKNDRIRMSELTPLEVVGRTLFVYAKASAKPVFTKVYPTPREAERVLDGLIGRRFRIEDL